ncbi:MAG: tannase/feruloyl esterase family alpha/beta hydrolase [Terracidiphilus sp.]
MRRTRMVAGLALGALCASGLAFGQTAAGGGKACADLSKLTLPQTEIVQATAVEAGAFVLEADPKDTLFSKLPAFCRVVAIARPSSDSNLKIEVWLPLAGWNGKFMGQGNGGFAGSINYRGLAIAVLSGFASGGTDTGHTGGATDADWALGHPEKIVDFGNRGVHVMTELSKAVVQAFYTKAAKPDYFSSCSDGGREALMEAQRFPADYDGIRAGAPAYNWTNLISHAAHVTKDLLGKPESYLPASKIPALNQAVLAACHKDEPAPFLADPRTCHFSPDTLLCKGAETDACLTQGQAESLKDLYADLHLHDGKLEYYGLQPGGELGDNGWPGWITGKSRDSGEGTKYAQGYFRNMVYSNANWDLQSFDIDRDLKAAKQRTGQQLDAVNPDLTAFKARGGKLILYHGWNDPAIAALATIDYYNSVVETLGQPETASFVRLFLVPGMQHCAGGPGPADFGQWGPSFNPALDDPPHNITFALEAWVEKGTAPEQVIARGNTDPTGAGKGDPFSEPICAWPKAAVYKGSGDRKDAASYVCQEK